MVTDAAVGAGSGPGLVAPLSDPGPVPPAPPPDPVAYAAAQWAQHTIRTISVTADRSLQSDIGMSELEGCPRKLAHRLAGTPAVNFPDPLPSFIGTGVHLALEKGLRRLDAGIGRFLIEHPVSYRSVPGTADLYDRWTREIRDWKTTKLKRLAYIRRDGPPRSHRTQLQGYAAGMKSQGLPVEKVTAVYIPVDGATEDIVAWSAPVDPTGVDAAIDRLAQVAATPIAEVPMAPSPLCPWCPFHSPHATDPAISCAGPATPI